MVYQELSFREWPHVKNNPDLELALKASVEVGRLLFNGFYSEYLSTLKADNSQLTPFDEQAELLAASIIKEKEADAIIQGEDSTPDIDISSGSFWTIDGIDGTTNFSRRVPICNFTMAKVTEGMTKLGVVHDFLHGLLYYGLEGSGAYENGQRIQVKERPFREFFGSFSPLLPVRDTGVYEAQAVDAIRGGMAEISELSGRFDRQFQSGGQELAWIASGRSDGFACGWTSPWDLSAGVLMVREAGGRATDILGRDWQPSNWGVIAGTQTVHPIMIDVFRRRFLDALGENRDQILGKLLS